MDTAGFNAETWDGLKTFTGACASKADVDAGAAIFALGDTHNSEPLEWMLPQPVIWYDDEDGEFAAVVVQAERHEGEGGEVLEVLGLVLPTGQTAVAFAEDVEEVDGVDETWLALIDAALDPSLEDEEAGE